MGAYTHGMLIFHWVVSTNACCTTTISARQTFLIILLYQSKDFDYGYRTTNNISKQLSYHKYKYCCCKQDKIPVGAFSCRVFVLV